MYRWLFTGFLCLFALVSFTQTVEELQQTARDFQRQGDYDNAILVLKRALDLQEGNSAVRQDMSMAYYLSRKYKLALDILQPLLNSTNTEEQVYQMAGMIHRSQLDYKEAEKIYKAGLKQYPVSGVLLNEYGELLETKNPGQGEGIKMWEKGIEVDPSNSSNYFNASRYYAGVGVVLWALVYGEIFINLESFSNRTIEIKNMLFTNYKKAFAYGLGRINEKNAFEMSVSEALLNQKSIAGTGVTPESLTAIRTRFILDWYNSAGDKYPFRLFERQRNMLREGLFDAYNQWMFGGAANIAAFQTWTQTNAESYQAFNQFQRSKLFNVVKGEYYKQ